MKTLLILHGALGSEKHFAALRPLLSGTFEVHTLNFEGHGGRSSDNPFSIELFAENALSYIVLNQLEECRVFGYSMGGYVALKLASMHPGKIDRIVTMGTKFAWSPEIAGRETAMLNPEKIEEKVPGFAAALQQLHAPADWKEVMRKTAAMMTALGEKPALQSAEMERLSLPVHLLLGSEDVMVTKEETMAVQAQIPGSELTIVEGWPHPIDRIDANDLAEVILSLLG